MSTRCSLPIVLLASLALCSAPTQATTTAATFGELSNFDAFCDVSDLDNYGATITACEGFEIEIEDVYSRDVVYAYWGNRYGHPSIVEDSFVDANNVTHPRVRVRYAAKWTGSGWQVDSTYASNYATGTNNVNINSVTATSGHTCVLGSSPSTSATYDTSGCEHFGVQLRASPSKVSYNWLVPVLDPNTNTATGQLQHSVSPVAVPPATYVVQPAPVDAVDQQPVVQAVIEAPPAPPFQEFGDAQWVKVYKRQSSKQLQLDKMMTDDASIPNGSDPSEIEVEWQLLQQVNPNPNWCLNANPPLALPCPAQPAAAPGALEGSDQLAAGNNSIVRRYEFYAYNGPYDAETHEATPYGNVSPPNGEAPDARDLGDYQGAQMQGVNVLLPLAVTDQIPTGEIGVSYVPTAIVSGGVQPYTTTVTSGSLPTGLTLSDVGVLSGTPSDAGTGLVSLEVHDFSGDVIGVKLNLNIVDAILVSTGSLPSGTAGVAYNANLTASGGVAPTTWTNTGTLPTGLSLSAAGVVSGTPTAAGTYTFSTVVTDSLNGTASKSFSIAIASGASTTPTICPTWSGSKLEGKSTVTSVGPGYVVVKGLTIKYTTCTKLKLNDVSAIAVGMPAQYTAYKDSKGVITASYLEIN